MSHFNFALKPWTINPEHCLVPCGPYTLHKWIEGRASAHQGNYSLRRNFSSIFHMALPVITTWQISGVSPGTWQSATWEGQMPWVQCIIASCLKFCRPSSRAFLPPESTAIAKALQETKREVILKEVLTSKISVWLLFSFLSEWMPV